MAQGSDFKGFPPGTTVDELWLYRRKKPVCLRAPDNLEIDQGSFKLLKSEYKKKFKSYYDFDRLQRLFHLSKEDLNPVRSSKPGDNLELEGEQDYISEYATTFVKFPFEKTSILRPKDVLRGNNDLLEMADTVESRVIPLEADAPRPPKILRRSLLRRPSTLKLEGDYYLQTEQAEKFIHYLLIKRRELMRRATNLKLEGNMDTSTENRENYIHHILKERPPMYKRNTNLHLEGILDVSTTEKQEKYAALELPVKHPLVKKLTNLHLEGNLMMIPEYRHAYIDHKNAERPSMILPINNLKTNGFDDTIPNVSEKFQMQVHPQIPFLRSSIDNGSNYKYARGHHSIRPEDNLKCEGTMRSMTENKREFVEKSLPNTVNRKPMNNLYLEGKLELHPEYKQAYINYYGDRDVPEVHQTNQVKQLRGGSINPQFVNFHVQRPQCSLSNDREIYYMTENEEKFVPHINVERTRSLKRESNLKPGGSFKCQPEYRKAYIDYLIRETSRKDGTHIRSYKSETHLHDPKDNLKPKDSKVTSIKPPVSITLSVPSSPRITAKQRSRSNSLSRNTSLSRIEASVFGPSLTVPNKLPPKAPSRSVSPNAIPRSKIQGRNQNHSATSSSTPQASSDSEKRQSRGKHFGSPIRVENLARFNVLTPLPTINTNSRRKWIKDDSVDSSNAFIVLDKEINNNCVMDATKSYPNNTIYKSRKFVPSWYNPPN